MEKHVQSEDKAGSLRPHLNTVWGMVTIVLKISYFKMSFEIDSSNMSDLLCSDKTQASYNEPFDNVQKFEFLEFT